jgi:DNA-binding NarL/FixJ family response regulator
MLEMEPDFEPVGEAASGGEAIEQVELLRPDIVVMDMNMPDMDGIEATRKLTDANPDLLVVMLTMFKGEEHLREARRAGASAYVLKDASTDVLVQTMRDVLSGETPLLQGSDQPAGEAVPRPPIPGSEQPKVSTGTDVLITSNEREILRLLASGLSNDQIAHQTGLPEDMVRTYLAEISRKLGLPSDRNAIIQYAREHGLDE